MHKSQIGGFYRKQVAYKAEAVNADGTFKGYGSIFGNVDAYNEVVAPGAFANSIKRIKASGDPLPALWQHKSDQVIGGYDVLAEDDRGLKVEGFLMINEIAQAREAHALMQRRVVKGLSIGYYIIDASYNEKDDIFTLKELDLREVSPVTFPANDQANIEEVKQLVKTGGRLPTEREFEEFLRDAGFSKAQALAICARGLKAVGQRGEPVPTILSANTFDFSLNF